MNSNDVDIHQLMDPERQVLFVLNECGGNLSISDIKEKLRAHRISIGTKKMENLLENALRDKRRKLIREGLVCKTKNGYEIMQKGIEYLNSTVTILDPLNESSNQDTVSNIIFNLSGDIKLCDPYFDDTAYALLKKHLNSDKVKSLRVLYNNNRVDATKNYKLKNYSIELKRKKELHDRFVIDDNQLYCLGASLNHIGHKLSFIFNLTVYKDTFNNLFQDYWDTPQQ